MLCKYGSVECKNGKNGKNEIIEIEEILQNLFSLLKNPPIFDLLLLLRCRYLQYFLQRYQNIISINAVA